MDRQTLETEAAKAYEAAAKRFQAANPKSQAAYETAVAELPGGNTRTVLFFEPFPLCTVRAQGCRLWDADGHEYVDFLGEYSAGLYGHSQPVILKALTDTLADGLSYGSHHAGEARLARLIRSRFADGHLELLRFTNSGTEATLMAVSAARLYTQRRRILVFVGGYHGSVFLFPGFNHPVNAPYEFLLAEYNDTGSVDAVIASAEGGPETIAAILVEPMLGSGGGVRATPAFLKHLRQRATNLGAVLILDEVMTSRMYSGGGIQSELGIRPDLTTLGKYLGGGMSFGAFGGKKEIMAMFDPRPRLPAAPSNPPMTVPHAGTFNNNVMTMRAGAVGLEQLFTPERARALHADGDRLRDRLNALGENTLFKVLGCGSILVFHFTAIPIDQILSPRDWKRDEVMPLLDLLHLEMLNEGIYMARRGYMALSIALGEAEFDLLVSAVGRFLDRYRPLIGLKKVADK